MSEAEGIAPISFRVTRWMLVLGQIAAFLFLLWMAYVKSDEFTVALGLVPLLGAIGVYKIVRWGRWMALLFLWVCIFLSLGSMVPFNVGDDIAAGIEPTSINILVTRLVVICSYSIWCIYALGKYEKQFRASWY